MIELTQTEVIDAILRAAAEKSGTPIENLGPITTWGQAYSINGRTLLVIDSSEVRKRP